MERVRIGIVGVGQIGKAHLDNYSRIPGAELVAAADVNETELRAVADRFSIPNVTTSAPSWRAMTSTQWTCACTTTCMPP